MSIALLQIMKTVESQGSALNSKIYVRGREL
jgi:hypothetical protein